MPDRDALDAAMVALEDAIITDQLEMRLRRLARHAAVDRAAVRKAAAEMGVEGVVREDSMRSYGEVTTVRLVLLPKDFSPGDRVRVVKVAPNDG